MRNLLYAMILLGLWCQSRLGLGSICLKQNEQCDCNSDTKTVICEQTLEGTNVSRAPVSLYLLEMTSFVDIKLANKKWNRLSLDAGFTFAKIPELRNLSLDSNSIQWIDDDFFSTGLDSLYTLDVGFNELTDCFNLNAPSLRIIILMGNKIETLDQTCFAGLKSLQHIRLSGNRIKQLDWNIYYLPSIQILEFSYNLIEDVSITNSEGLEYLDLSFNIIKGPMKLKNLTSLSSLDLRLNAHKAFPDLGEHENLKEIRIDDQFIGYIDSAFLRKLPGLITLSMGTNTMKVINSFAFKYSASLTYLYLSNNRVENIELNGFAGLGNLTILTLSSNQLQKLPSNVFKPLTQLQQLYLNWNALIELESRIFVDLSNTLTTLDMSFNKLNFIKQDWLFGLGKLTNLNLSHNSISHIELKSFDSLTSLDNLDLSNNCMFRIHSSTFSSLSRLVNLYLDENVLATIDPSSFTVLQSLNKLSMRGNQIWSRLPVSLFHNLTKLEHLYMDDNHLSTVDFSQFVGLKSLYFLSISENNLSTMNSSLDKLTSLKTLDLSRNSFKVGNQSFSNLNISKRVVDNLAHLSLSHNEIYMERLIKDYNLSGLEGLYLQAVNLYKSFEAFDHLELKRLRWFDLSDNDFRGMNVVKMINQHIHTLERLGLSNTSVLSSHLDFSNLSNLRWLDLSLNKIREIRNKPFERNYNLELLNLSHNNISFLGKDSLNNLTNLVTLDLSSNAIKTLAEDSISISKYTRLEILRISNNNLDYFFYNLDCSEEIISVNFSHNKLASFSLAPGLIFSKLSQVDLSFNQIDRLTPGSFKIGIAIQVLDLSHNKLVQLPQFIFKYLNRLKKLRLDQNNLTKLIEHVFESLLCLEELYLQSNQLETLTDRDFFTLKNLLILNVNFNRLKRIDQDSFDRLYQLKILHIAGNTDLEDFNNQTFENLTNIRGVVVSRLNENNFLAIKQSFKPQLKKKSLGIEYYQSIDITYSRDIINIFDSDCRYTLELIKVNIKLNLLSSDGFDLFIGSCQNLFRTLLLKMVH